MVSYWAFGLVVREVEVVAMRIVEVNANQVFLREQLSTRISQGLLLTGAGTLIIGFFVLFAVVFSPFFYSFVFIGIWVVYVGVYGLAGSRRITAESWVNQLIFEHHGLRFLIIPHSIRVNFSDVKEVQLQHLPATEAGSYSRRESFAVLLRTVDEDAILIWNYHDIDTASEISNAIAVVMDKLVVRI